MPGQLFSSCSAADLSVSLLHGGGMCLFNVPQPEHLLGGPRCGNLYVEKGEECDCGLLEVLTCSPAHLFTCSPASAAPAGRVYLAARLLQSVTLRHS